MLACEASIIGNGLRQDTISGPQKRAEQRSPRLVAIFSYTQAKNAHSAELGLA